MTRSFADALRIDMAGLMGTGTDPVPDADVVRVWRALSTLMEVDEYLDLAAKAQPGSTYPAALYQSDAAAALARLDVKTADDYLDVTWRQIRRRCDAVGLSVPEAVA